MRFCKVSLLLIVVLLISSLVACQKNVDPKTPEQILTGNPWKIDELRYLQNNIAYYYKRGVSTSGLSDEYLEFYNDNTGKYHDHNAITVPLTWNFINSDKTSIRYTLGYAPQRVITWENVIFSEKSIRYTEYYIADGVNSLAEGIRTPK